MPNEPPVAGKQPGLTAELIDQQLTRILFSSRFSRSVSLGRLLRYIVLRSQSSESVKEYDLGVDVFDRGAGFDQQKDNIVRVQIRNLRERVQAYYAAEGAGDLIVIDVPKGAYTATFTVRTALPEVTPPQPQPAVAAERLRRTDRGMWLAASLVLLFAVSLAYLTWGRNSELPKIQRPGDRTNTIAVLPFVNLSGDAANDYVADGLTEEVIESLLKVEGLEVVARSSVFALKGKTIDLTEVGNTLRIASIVEGSIRKNGSQFRIAARLIDARTGLHMWSTVYTRNGMDVALIQEDIANAIAATLKLKLIPARRQHHPATPEVYDLYLKARQSWQLVNPEYQKQALAYGEQAIALDPNFAPTYVVMAGAYGSFAVFNMAPPREMYPKGKAMALRAIELDPSLAEAHALYAGTLAWFDWDYAAAEKEYRLALDLTPSSAIVHQYYASFLGAFGRTREADVEMGIAARLDPLNPLLQWGASQLVFWKHDYPAAAAQFRKQTLDHPRFYLPYASLAMTQWELNDWNGALNTIAAWRQFAPEHPLALSALGYTRARMGATGEARQILADLYIRSKREYVRANAMALIHIGLGEKPAAIEQLEKACYDRAIRPPGLRADPVYARLLPEPAFQRLLRKTNVIQ